MPTKKRLPSTSNPAPDGNKHGKSEYSFPLPPIQGADLLVPLLTPDDVAQDAREMNLPHEAWLDEEICAHVAYLFSWRGNERATVLTIFNAHKKLAHLECQAYGEAPVMPATLKAIYATVTEQFRLAGFEIKLKTASP